MQMRKTFLFQFTTIPNFLNVSQTRMTSSEFLNLKLGSFSLGFTASISNDYVTPFNEINWPDDDPINQLETINLILNKPVGTI